MFEGWGERARARMGHATVLGAVDDDRAQKALDRLWGRDGDSEPDEMLRSRWRDLVAAFYRWDPELTDVLLGAPPYQLFKLLRDPRPTVASAAFWHALGRRSAEAIAAAESFKRQPFAEDAQAFIKDLDEQRHGPPTAEELERKERLAREDREFRQRLEAELRRAKDAIAQRPALRASMLRDVRFGPRNKDWLPDFVTAYHCGGKAPDKPWTLERLGSGEGFNNCGGPLGPGIYFASEAGTARMYCKYAGREAYLYTCRLDTRLFEERFWKARPSAGDFAREAKLKVFGREDISLSSICNKPVADILDFRARLPWSGRYENLGPAGIELVVFDTDAIEVLDVERVEL